MSTGDRERRRPERGRARTRQRDRDRGRGRERERRAAERDPGSIWARPEPGRRRPRFTRDEIAAKALEIADGEGFEAVSMRRLATELGAGTMTLYHYVRTKDELIALMDDAIMGEVVVPAGELPSDWREALALIARRSYAAFSRHPWSFKAFSGGEAGPNGMRHFEQSLQAVAGLEVPIGRRLELVLLVDDYVFGHFVRTSGALFEEPPREQVEASSEHILEWVESGDYPNVAELIGGRSLGAAWDVVYEVMGDEGRFERGLQRLLDGIALELDR